jgi:L-alanine-DL-glutamate epimerase-like enolase superfamily enzyme
MNRRRVLSQAFLAGPAAILANAAQGDRPRSLQMPAKVTGIEVLYLEKPLKERFWMANAPIGGYQPKASRLIVRLHTDAGITGEGEGSGGPDLFRKGFADLIIGEDPFMVGRIWERMFGATYGREPSTRGWSRNGIISAMAPIDAALYDIMAKSAGLPLFKFLGGYRDSVPV